MRLVRIATVLLFAAGIAGPAAANWFDNTVAAGENHKKQVGSTLTPTPDDLRAIGDSGLGKGKSYRFDEKGGHWHEVKPEDEGNNAGLPTSPRSTPAREPSGANGAQSATPPRSAD
jgi:hypothetical protein